MLQINEKIRLKDRFLSFRDALFCLFRAQSIAFAL